MDPFENPNFLNTCTLSLLLWITGSPQVLSGKCGIKQPEKQNRVNSLNKISGKMCPDYAQTLLFQSSCLFHTSSFNNHPSPSVHNCSVGPAGVLSFSLWLYKSHEYSVSSKCLMNKCYFLVPAFFCGKLLLRGVSLLPSASVSFVTLHEGTRGYNNPLLESRTARRSPDSLVLSDQMIPGSEVSKFIFHAPSQPTNP